MLHIGHMGRKRVVVRTQGTPVRLYDNLDVEIIKLLRARTCRSNEVVDAFRSRWSRPTVLKHLQWLRDNGMVEEVHDPTHSQAKLNVLVPPIEGFFEAIDLLEKRAAEIRTSNRTAREKFDLLMKDVVMPSTRLMYGAITPKTTMREGTVASLHWVNFLSDSISHDIKEFIKAANLEREDLLIALRDNDRVLYDLLQPEARRV